MVRFNFVTFIIVMFLFISSIYGNQINIMENPKTIFYDCSNKNCKLLDNSGNLNFSITDGNIIDLSSLYYDTYYFVAGDLRYKNITAPTDLSVWAHGYKTLKTWNNFKLGSRWKNFDLNQDKCSISNIDYNISQNTLKLNSSLKSTSSLPTFLEEYYYMKTFVFMKADNGINKFYFKPNESTNYYSYNKTKYNPSYGGTTLNNQLSDLGTPYSDASLNLSQTGATRVPYVLLKPNTNTFTFDMVNINDTLKGNCNSDSQYCGTYNISVYAVPIDGKCDFNNSGILDSNSEFMANDTSLIQNNITIFEDTDNDGWDDRGNLGKGHDLCVGETGTNDNYRGCFYAYSSLSCTNKASFSNGKINCNSGDWGKRLYFDISNYTSKTIRLVDKRDASSSNIHYFPDKGAGFYSCYDGPHKDDGWIGYCQLRANFADSCNGPSDSIIPRDGLSRNFYKYPFILKSRFETSGFTNFHKDFTCNIGGGQTTIDFSIFKYSSPQIIDDMQTGFDITADGRLIGDTKISKRRFYHNLTNEKTYFVDGRGIRNEFTLPLLNESSNRSITIYKNGVFNRSEVVDPMFIALHSSKIRKFKTLNQANKFVNNSVNLMTKFNIVKNLTTDGVNTNVKIQLRDYTNSDIKNLTIYQIFPKSLAADISNINFISNGGGQLIVLDKDPVIGWYFNDSNGNVTIEYNVSGTNEGGTIIITQEPILFNEGELVINYRETSCNVGEAELFELDNLEDSKVYSSGSNKFYKVCVAHLTENLKNTKTDLYKHVFNYTNSSNVSINNLVGFNDNVYISVVNSTPIYWDLKVQETNPTGNYSCLGSVNDLDESLFGDCGYNSQNRIWLHLGDDLIPPTTTLSYPYLSHVLTVSLIGEDNMGGSGFKQTKYCVDDSGTCNPQKTYSKPFSLTCANDWGCNKFVRYFSEDIAGNLEEVQTKKLTILDKGSACQSDCTVRPAPNRYLAECRNINSCSFFDKGGDDGEYVANKCNLMIPNSWVSYNSSHEIQCPSGPFRKSRYSNESLSVINSLCENIIKTPYPVILNGEQIIMNIITCVNPY